MQFEISINVLKNNHISQNESQNFLPLIKKQFELLAKKVAFYLSDKF